MQKVKRVTIAYDPREDRLRLSALDRQGKALGAWLTQRMANFLVTSLIECLDDAVASRPDVIGGARAAAPPAAQFVAQAKAELQQSAADRQKGSPVPTRLPKPPTGAEFVIERVRMRKIDDIYVLDLKWADDGISLPGDQTWLRQFLRVLHKNYRTAGWPVDQVWPEWFGENAHRTVLGAHQIN